MRAFLRPLTVVSFLLLPGWMVLAGQTPQQATQPTPQPPQFSIQIANGGGVSVRGTVPSTATRIVVCRWANENDWTSAQNGTCATPGVVAAEYAAPSAEDTTTAKPISLDPKNPGTFSAELDAHACQNGALFSVYYDSPKGSADSPQDSAASITASPCPGKGAKGTSAAKTSATLNVSLPYCDQSPAYTYTDALASKPEVDVWVKDWSDVGQQVLTDFHDAHEIGDPTIELPDSRIQLVQPPAHLSNGGATDPVALGKGESRINDAGGPLLTSASAQTFTADANLAQRLLVRTQFGPNFSRLACSYSYLTGTLKNGHAKDFSGKPETITARPTGHAVSLIGPDAPQYYLFNIVRWSDAGAQTNGAAQSKSPNAKISMYQADSEWYLLNFSDLRDKHRDLAQAVKKLPYFDQGTMAILSSSRVLFVGIHLAPAAKYSGPLPATDPGIPLVPTEQAWYDNINIQYTFQSKSVSPINIADFQTLVSAVLGISSPAQAGNGETPAPFGVEGLPPGPEAQTTPIADLLRRMRINYFLTGIKPDPKSGQFAPMGKFANDLSNLLEKLHARGSEPGCNPGHEPPFNTKEEAGLDSCYNAIEDSHNSDLKSAISSALSALNDDLGNTKQVFSTYQGLYAAGLVNNLTQLPQGVSNAANFSATWTASFSGAPDVQASSDQPQAAPSTKVPLQSTNNRTKQKKSASTEDSSGGSGSAKAGTKQSKGTTEQSRADGSAAGQSSSSQTAANAASAPSACTLSTTSGPGGEPVQASCTNTSPSVHDEAIAYWDISVAVPVKGFSDVSFQQTTTASNATVYAPGPASTKRENAYGMFDLFVVPPFGQDLYRPPTLGLPYVAAGLPLAGKVFDKPYFAAGEMITLQSIQGIGKYIGNILPVQLRPMYGWVWNKEFKTVPASGNTPARQVFYRRALEPQFSIEVSIKGVASKLGKSGGGTSK